MTTAPVLDAAARKELKALAHHLDPVVMIGESGLTDAVLAETDRALSRHKLIKIRVFGDDRDARADIMRRLCDSLQCAPVQSIGKLLVIWRPGDEDTAEKASSDRKPRGPYQPKKAVGSGAKPSAAKPKAKERPRRAPAGSGSSTERKLAAKFAARTGGPRRKEDGRENFSRVLKGESPIRPGTGSVSRPAASESGARAARPAGSGARPAGTARGAAKSALASPRARAAAASEGRPSTRKPASGKPKASRGTAPSGRSSARGTGGRRKG